jgi:threonine synthase
VIEHVRGLQCTLCGTAYAPSEVTYTCPACGSDGNLDVLYDYDSIAANWNADQVKDIALGLWRYKTLLPIAYESKIPPLSVGGTPMYQENDIAASLGLREVWIKDDGRNPTGSLKDRASALVVARAMEEGRDIVTTASTGNAGAALAGVAASVGIPSVIFAPAKAPQAKVAQLLVYGATVLLVDGTYDQAFELCLGATEMYNWYCRNTGFNPYTTEGKKTVSYEICEQLSGQHDKFTAPDHIFVSVGDGNIIAGVHKGLKDLLALGWIGHMPKLVGVQAEGSAALYQAWMDGIDPAKMQPIDANTVADSISAGLPRDRVKAMNAVQQTNGFFMTVTDEEIIGAIPLLARASGVFAEPAGAAAYAGLLKAVRQGQVDSDECVVVLITGSGLKDIASAMRSVSPARVIAPTLEAVGEAVFEIFGM